MTDAAEKAIADASAIVAIFFILYPSFCVLYFGKYYHAVNYTTFRHGLSINLMIYSKFYKKTCHKKFTCVKIPAAVLYSVPPQGNIRKYQTPKLFLRFSNSCAPRNPSRTSFLEVPFASSVSQPDLPPSSGSLSKNV